MKIKNRAQYLQLFRGKLLEEEMFLLDFAYNLTKYSHGYLEQKRDGGERYFNHPREVSGIIAREFGVFDAETHMVALMHDCPEDTYLMTYDRIKWVFGKKVADAVLAVTKTNYDNASKDDYLKGYFANIRKSGWRACLIKCADRVHNLRTLPDKTESDLKKIVRQINETKTAFFDFIPVIAKHNADLAEKVQKALEKELKRLSKKVT